VAIRGRQQANETVTRLRDSAGRFSTDRRQSGDCGQGSLKVELIGDSPFPTLSGLKGELQLFERNPHIGVVHHD
jgi:hypothetical protein